MTNRHIAYNILNSVLKDGAYINLALKAGLNGMDSSTSALITALTYATVENLNYSDYLLSYYVNGRLHGSVRLILRMGIAELLTMNTPPHAVCNESVKLTKAIGKGSLSGFVNGVLRNIVRGLQCKSLPELPSDDAEYLNIRYGIPDFLAKEYLELYGREFTENMLKYRFNSMTVRAQYPYTTEEILHSLATRDKAFDGVAISRGQIVDDALILRKGIDANSSSLFKDGKIAIQSESAMLVCKVCSVSEGMRVLDACAAPGGKTAYLASVMKNTGSITAWDIHENRIKLTQSTLKRLHVTNAVCLQHNAAEPMPELYKSMDVVLVDVPCSGFGVGSKPDTFINRTVDSVKELCRVQRSILECCCKYVKIGGTLVYSTCTVSKRENEDNIHSFLAEHAEFEPDPFDHMLPQQLSDRGKSGTLQLFPHIDGTDGFFIAKMKRRV